MELPVRKTRESPQKRLMDAVKEDMQIHVTEEDARNARG